MMTALAVAGGGAIGALGRVWLADRLHAYPPTATLLVNVFGSFAAGVAVSMLDGAALIFVAVGLCGALTTFSTFANEVVAYHRGGEHRLALGYAIGTALTCVSAAALGLAIG